MSRSVSVAQRVLASIKEDIINEVIKDGEIITERALESRYGVSRTPIKEALKLLEVDGWVEITPRQETRVIPFSITEIRETLPIRIAIEGMALKLCIQNLDDESRGEFEQLLAELRQLGKKIDAEDDDTLAVYNALDDRFHTMIFTYSKSRLLCLVNRSRRSLVERVYRRIPLAMGRIREGSNELIRIVEYVLSANSLHADIHINNHITNSIEHKIQALQAEAEK